MSLCSLGGGSSHSTSEDGHESATTRHRSSPFTGCDSAAKSGLMAGTRESEAVGMCDSDRGSIVIHCQPH